MKRIFTACILAIVFFAYHNSVRADYQKTKIAVLDFQRQGKGFETEDIGQIVAEWLVTALVKEGRFDVVERRLLEKIVTEQQLSETGLLDKNTTSQLGKVLGVKVMVTGSVMRIQDTIEVNARIIDVGSGSILAAENIKSEDTIRLKALIEQMAKKIISVFPLEGYIVKRNEENVTIDLGRLNGAAHGMKFIVYKEGEVLKHPKTGEILSVQKIQTGYIKIHKVSEKISEGAIIDESGFDTIKYGQMVKSVPKGPQVRARPRVIPVKKGTLTVHTEPAESVIKILNIKPLYYSGIPLDPGRYQIEVSSSGYQTRFQWIVMEREDLILHISLEPVSKPRTLVAAPPEKRKPVKPKDKIKPTQKKYPVKSNFKAQKRDGQYVSDAKGVVRDNKTGLEWLAGRDVFLNWYEVKRWVNDLNKKDRGWRMPTIKELSTLYKKGLGDHNITPLLKTTGWMVWSSEKKGADFYYFDFHFGSKLFETWNFRNGSYYGFARGFAVRSIK